MVLKAISFAIIGVVNTAVDALAFFLAYRWLTASPVAAEAINWAIDRCHCAAPAAATLVAANTFSWCVAASGSYVMNSTITFAAESGRRLRLSAYLMFLASGIVGYLANTTTLVVVAHAFPLVLPQWPSLTVYVAKGCAILVSFVVNFSMSHFVVFRVRRPGVNDASS
jgi:putative flippase GtrA